MLDRGAVLDLVWAKAEPLVYISREEFLKPFADWQIDQIEVDGVVQIIVLSNGPHFHFQTLGTNIPITRATVRAVVQPIIDRHGFALTRTPKIDNRQHRFNRLVGFQAVGEDEFDIFYRVDAETLLARKGSRACQS